MILEVNGCPPESLEQAVGLAVGAASVCWDDPGGAGVFRSDVALQICSELLAYVREHTVDVGQPGWYDRYRRTL